MSIKQLKGELVSKTVPNLFSERIEEFKQLFPEVVTEGKIDFDKLKEIDPNGIDTLFIPFMLRTDKIPEKLFKEIKQYILDTLDDAAKGNEDVMIVIRK